MKIPISEQREHRFTSNNPLVKRAHEIVDDLIMEYGIWIKMHVDFDTRVEKKDHPEYGIYNDTHLTVTRIYYPVDESIFETIKTLRKALENKAFL